MKSKFEKLVDDLMLRSYKVNGTGQPVIDAYTVVGFMAVALQDKNKSKDDLYTQYLEGTKDIFLHKLEEAQRIYTSELVERTNSVYYRAAGRFLGLIEAGELLGVDVSKYYETYNSKKTI